MKNLPLILLLFFVIYASAGCSPDSQSQSAPVENSAVAVSPPSPLSSPPLVPGAGPSVNQKALDALLAPEKLKYERGLAGLNRHLPIEQWRDVYVEAQIANHQADKDMYKAYPDPTAGEPLTPEFLKKQTDYGDELSEKYVARVGKRHHLTKDEINALVQVGAEKRWPYPGFNPPDGGEQ